MQNTGVVFLYKPPENGGELEADLRVLQPLTSGTALPKRIRNFNSLRADDLWAMSFLLYSYCFGALTFPSFSHLPQSFYKHGNREIRRQ